MLLLYVGRGQRIVLEAEMVQRVWRCSAQHVKMMSKALASKLPSRHAVSLDKVGNSALTPLHCD